MLPANSDQRAALYDVATGLPNIGLTRELLARWISLAQRNDRIVAVLDLKLLGNTSAGGEPSGDSFLQQFRVLATVLQNTIRHSDFCGLSDEGSFLITFGSLFSPGDTYRVVNRLLRELRKQTPLAWDEPNLVGGISLYPVDGGDADLLILRAREARIAASRANTYFEFFSHQVSQSIVHHTVLEDRLLQALAGGELQVRYRPQYGLTSRRIEGIEALLFWQHPELGMISPGQLVELAEDLGLSVKIGTYVLEQAMERQLMWHRGEGSPVELLVYLPAPSFIDRCFVAIVRGLLDKPELVPGTLTLGLSESGILHNPEKSSAVLTAFAELGVKLSVFGFGAGHASLTQLILYPIDSLTLDAVLTRNGLSDRRARLLVEASLAVVHKLGLPVTAAGLQQESQAQWLQALGCSRAQRPLFGQPVDADTISVLLQKRTESENN